MLAVPQASGAVVVTAPYGTATDLSGRADSDSCVTGVQPAGPPLDQRVVPVLCDLGGPAPVLLVVGPRGATSVRLLDAAGTDLDDRLLDDGVAVVPDPGVVAAVEVTTSEGRTVTAPVVEETDLRG